MDSIIFATNNQNKVNEVRAVLGDRFTIITLQEAGIDIDIPEPHDTLEANATEKSKTIFALTGQHCFSEDSGLEVEALQGEPGVNSAHYAGDRNPVSNIEKLLLNLEPFENKAARFRTVISLMLQGTEYLFEGICPGHITGNKKGDSGFGYDPVFIPAGSNKTFAEMDMAEKNKFSHRKKAMDKLIQFLNTRYEQN